MTPSFFRKTGFFLFLAVAVVAGIYMTRSPADKIPASALIIEPAAGDDVAQPAPLTGTFSLTDQNGVAVTEKDYPGQYRLVFFGFTSCPDTCPTGLKKLASALALLGDEAGSVKPLFITVDPARDTPDVLRDYTAQFDPRLTGLTGTAEQIKAAEESFKVYAAQQPIEDQASEHDHGEHSGHDEHGGHDYTMDHSAFIYLQDPEGNLVDFFGADESAADIAAAVKTYLNNG